MSGLRLLFDEKVRRTGQGAQTHDNAARPCTSRSAARRAANLIVVATSDLQIVNLEDLGIVVAIVTGLAGLGVAGFAAAVTAGWHDPVASRVARLNALRELVESIPESVQSATLRNRYASNLVEFDLYLQQRDSRWLAPPVLLWMSAVSLIGLGISLAAAANTILPKIDEAFDTYTLMSFAYLAFIAGVFLTLAMRLWSASPLRRSSGRKHPEMREALASDYAELFVTVPQQPR